MRETRVAIDIGGTFTDICVLNETTGEMRVAKTSSTPGDPMQGAMNALKVAEVDLNDVSLFSHGTTVATNALITRNLPPSAMVCTEGYRDVVEIRRSDKEDTWDTYKDVAAPYVRRRDRLTVPERTDYNGEIIKPLDEDAAREVARILKKRDVKAVSICFMNSFTNPTNELRMKEILNEELRSVSVTTSSETLPEIFEHERFSTAMVNSILSPVVGDYVNRMSDELKSGGYDRDLLILHTGGGVMTAAACNSYAGRIAGSGIAAGAIACRYIANLCGYENAIGVDMGGTSTDVCLVHEGNLRVTKDWHIEFGYPIRFPSIEVLTIGAGGGSLAWIDEGGSLRNGPQSAGSDPGPVCYLRGGETPTTTDANVTLGRLGTALAGGQVTLDRTAAVKAVTSEIAEPLGLQTIEAAKAIVSVANANMADAVRLISISRGYDPRDFVLVAFGGAGSLHGVALAKDLSIPIVLVPPNPGVTSALGCLLVDVQHDYSKSYLVEAADANAGDIEAEFAALEDKARKQLGSEGISEEDMAMRRTIDMMYHGQWRSLQVSVTAPFTSVEAAVDGFHADHMREYSYNRKDTEVSLFRLNLTAIGIVPKADFKQRPPGDHVPSPGGMRVISFDERLEAIETPVYQHDDLPVGIEMEGPLVIDQLDSTVLVPPGTRAEVDGWSNIRIHIEKTEEAE